MIYSIDVEITAPVRDTEVTDRVSDAVTNLFPEAEVTEAHGEIRGEAHSMDHFSEQLHRQEILDTARGAFFENHNRDVFTFELKKGPAFEGRVNFAVGNPDELGDMHVRVYVDEPSVEEFIDAVAPQTEDGKPITSDEH